MSIHKNEDPVDGNSQIPVSTRLGSGVAGVVAANLQYLGITTIATSAYLSKGELGNRPEIGQKLYEIIQDIIKSLSPRKKRVWRVVIRDAMYQFNNTLAAQFHGKLPIFGTEERTFETVYDIQPPATLDDLDNLFGVPISYLFSIQKSLPKTNSKAIYLSSEELQDLNFRSVLVGILRGVKASDKSEKKAWRSRVGLAIREYNVLAIQSMGKLIPNFSTYSTTKGVNHTLAQVYDLDGRVGLTELGQLFGEEFVQALFTPYQGQEQGELQESQESKEALERSMVSIELDAISEVTLSEEDSIGIFCTEGGSIDKQIETIRRVFSERIYDTFYSMYNGTPQIQRILSSYKKLFLDFFDIQYINGSICISIDILKAGDVSRNLTGRLPGNMDDLIGGAGEDLTEVYTSFIHFLRNEEKIKLLFTSNQTTTSSDQVTVYFFPYTRVTVKKERLANQKATHEDMGLEGDDLIED